MSASADSQRYFYGESLGPTQILSANTTGVACTKLAPGRYLVRYRTVSGATLVWVQKGTEDLAVGIATAAPSAPFDLLDSAGTLFITQVFGVSQSAQEATRKRADRLVFRTSAGTVDIVITKISEGLA